MRNNPIALAVCVQRINYMPMICLLCTDAVTETRQMKPTEKSSCLISYARSRSHRLRKRQLDPTMTPFPRRSSGAVKKHNTEEHRVLCHCVSLCAVCFLVGCLTSQQQASVFQGRICTDNFTCCHTETEVADQTFYLTQSQYIDTEPTIPVLTL